MNVVNDSGGTLAASAFKVHVLTDGKDISGSPQDGSEKGTRYTLVAGTAYAVEADGIAGYALSESGDCAVTLQEGQNAVCTITANDIAPRLRVITEVVNDDNGNLELGMVSVHVRRGRDDVPGSPKPGTADPGAEYELMAGVVHRMRFGYGHRLLRVLRRSLLGEGHHHPRVGAGGDLHADARRRRLVADGRHPGGQRRRRLRAAR